MGHQLHRPILEPHRKTAAGPIFDDIRRCVACGICLTACPTYQMTLEEWQSPRGRIAAMRAVAEGLAPLNDRFAAFMYDCLACRACEAVCPSGVPFGRMVEAARTEAERVVRRPLTVRLGRWLLLDWALRSRAAFGRFVGLLELYRRMPGRDLLTRVVPGLGAATALFGDGADGTALPERVEAWPPVVGRAVLLTGCVMAFWFRAAHLATARALAAAGYEVLIPGEQWCCGALHFHNGRPEAGRRLAADLIRTVLNYGPDVIVTNSAGCGSTLKEYPDLLAGTPLAEAATEFGRRVRDIHEVLLVASRPLGLRAIRRRVAVENPCHLVHAQRLGEVTRRLLGLVPGLEVVVPPDANRCCGAAGIYGLERPEMSARLLSEKLDRLEPLRPDEVLAANPGCLLQLRAGVRARGWEILVRHPIELIAEALPD